ncbi:MAG: HAD-IA family hydrolase [Lentimicrobiaceae bacterium]|nr:HAD-IA family hydrolase [Lentimicrobiaceae bacterium]
MQADKKAELYRLNHFFFDLDGTLADSKADVLGSIEQAYQSLGWEYDASKLRIGPLLPDIISAISPQLDSAQRQTVAQTFRAFYAAGKYRQTVLFPGVLKFLDTLREQGKTLYVATNKPKKPTYEVLTTLGISDHFFFVGTPDFEGDHLPKPEVLKAMVRMFNIDPSQAVMVGDTLPDIEAGRYAGMCTLAFTGGYGGETFAVDSGADFIVSDYRELL